MEYSTGMDGGMEFWSDHFGNVPDRNNYIKIFMVLPYIVAIIFQKQNSAQY